MCNFVEVGLERGLREGLETSDSQLLTRILRTYASLGTISHAHQHVAALMQMHFEEVGVYYYDIMRRRSYTMSGVLLRG